MNPSNAISIRIYYEDTDSGGVVYYASYLRYFERARTEFFRTRGIEVAEYMDRGILFVVARLEVDYRHPSRYNDLLRVDTRIGETGRASFTFVHRIIHSISGRLSVEAVVKMVCVDSGGKPRRLPPEVLKVVEEAPGPADASG